ncbi:hypothetical protein [Virgibacillus salexigens]|uniref:Uncharacterized protein n=1 Tax=Virgibacillus kapii TaxID=1638645 RepID=A0ABQ2DNP3_9BACI|nr:hypothetical protein [Virgibacillus kapii]GGJ61764.1 hypothetical protein GCM10007111_24850 [Virgibacillus kapii]
MTHEELEAFRNRFNEINESKEPVRTNRLSILMTDMEQTYNIPNFYSAAFNYHNPQVIKLYRQVSYARFFEGVK